MLEKSVLCAAGMLARTCVAETLTWKGGTDANWSTAEKADGDCTGTTLLMR